MSRNRDSTGKPSATRPPARRALLEDLESIRALLDAESPRGEQIPVLREVVPAAPARRRRPGGAEARSEGEVQGELFDARSFAERLLDDSWQEESEAILGSAREQAEASTRGRPPEEIEAAMTRFRERMAAEIPPLLDQIVGEAVDDLQQRMLRTLRNEITRLVEDCFGSPPDNHD